MVVKIGIGNQSSFLAGQVYTQAITKAHAYHIVAPGIHGILYAAIFLLVAYHVIQSPTEEGIARGTKRRHKWQGGCMAVAAYIETSEVETMTASEGRCRRDDTFGKEGKPLRSLEG